jgi:hypothetical protein
VANAGRERRPGILFYRVATWFGSFRRIRRWIERSLAVHPAVADRLRSFPRYQPVRKNPTPSRPGVLLHAVNRTKARDREADPSGLLFVFGINRIRKKQGAAGITTAASSVCNGSPKSTVIQKSDIASMFYKS